MEELVAVQALLAARILGVEVGSTAPLFLGVLGVHVPAGLVAVVTGAGAAVSRKGSARHVRFGRWHYGAVAVVAATATVLVVLRWRQDWYLVVLGAVAFTAGTVGVLARRRHWPGDTAHVLGMAGSYLAMLTAFYVDNGPHLPLWSYLPGWTFWVLPTLVGAPLTVRALLRARAVAGDPTVGLAPPDRSVVRRGPVG
jgi:hypothetical protein